MKRLIPIALALMLTVSLCACGETVTPQSTDEPQPLNTPVPVVIEKDDGLLTEEVYYNADGLRYMTVRYEYDGSGYVAKKLTFGVNEAPESYTAYEYTQDGKIIREGYFNAVDAENYESAGECVYEYGDDGLCLKKYSVRDDFESLYEYQYNSDGLLSVEKCYTSGGRLEHILNYEYDANGNNTRLILQNIMLETEVITDMEYDTNGRLILVRDGDGYSELEYNEHGDETKKSFFGADGEPFYVLITEYEYDEAGNIIKETNTSEGGTFAATVTEYRWTYAKG